MLNFQILLLGNHYRKFIWHCFKVLQIISLQWRLVIKEQRASENKNWSLYLFPPVARTLMCNAVIPIVLHRSATSWAANIAAYGEDSSRSAFTFIPPVTRTIVSLHGQHHGNCNYNLSNIIGSKLLLKCVLLSVSKHGTWKSLMHLLP